MSDEGLRGDWPAPQQHHTPTTPEAPAAQHAGAHQQAPAAQHTSTGPQPPAPQHAPSPVQPPDAQHTVAHAAEKVAKVSRRGLRFVAAGGAAAALAAVVVYVAARKDDTPAARPQAPATGSAVTVPAGSPASTPGTPLTGSVAPQGSTTMAFTAEAGSVSYFAASPDCTATGLQWDVEDTSGVPLGPAAVICGDVGRIEFTTSGTYQVRVYAVGEVGGDFSIVRKDSRPDTFDAITAGETVSGDVDLPGARDFYEFDATAGTIAWFSSPDCSDGDLQWDVEDATGRTVGPAAVVCGDVGRIEFTADGRYRVRVYSVGGRTGTYSIAWKESRPDRVASITSGQTASGNIDLPGAQDLYELQADAGTVAYFASAGDGCTDNGAYWVVEDESGAVLAATAVMCGDIGRVVFPATGTYRVRVYSVSGGVGPYEIRWLTSRADTERALSLGSTARGNLDLPGSHDVWTFRAQAGQTIAFAAAANCTANEFVWTVTTPEGTAVAGANAMCGDIGDVTFSDTGEYQVVVTGGGQATGAYSFDTQPR